MPDVITMDFVFHIHGVPELKVMLKQGDRVDCSHHKKNQKKIYPKQLENFGQENL